MNRWTTLPNMMMVYRVLEEFLHDVADAMMRLDQYILQLKVGTMNQSTSLVSYMVGKLQACDSDPSVACSVRAVVSARNSFCDLAQGVLVFGEMSGRLTVYSLVGQS